ncbi:MAG: antitoxin VapB family protein [Methanoregula sp.]|jgi:predicted CopG family antitoxin
MKTITLRDEVYDNLIRLKQNNNSFSDVIEVLLEKKTTDIEQYFGALRDSPVLDDIGIYAKDSRRWAWNRT